MTLSYRPAETPLHRLDPRAKLAFQFGFTAAAFAHTTPTGLALLTPIAVTTPILAGSSPLEALSEFWLALPFLMLAPIAAGITLGPPWIRPEAALPTLYASYRVLLLLLVAGAYIYSTPVRDSRAAIRWLLPGRIGQATGVGVALVFRFLPVLQGDLASRRDAIQARLGSERPVRDRIRFVAIGGLRQTFARTDRLSTALQARCFSWNPTQPPLAYRPADWVTTAAGLTLVVSVFV